MPSSPNTGKLFNISRSLKCSFQSHTEQDESKSISLYLKVNKSMTPILVSFVMESGGRKYTSVSYFANLICDKNIATGYHSNSRSSSTELVPVSSFGRISA